MAALRGPTLREEVRKWLYTLHETVNRDRGIVSGITIEQIPDLYKGVDIRTEWGKFFELMKVNAEIGQVSQSVLQNFYRHLGVLRKLLGR